ncbi:Ntf2-like protein, partial [Colletotrichum tofieldiae]
MASIPNTPAEVLDWLQRSHDVHDSLQVIGFHKIYSLNAQVKFANYPVAEGLDAIKEAFVPTFDQLSYMKHVTRQADKVGDRIWLAVDITYRVKDDLEREDINIPASGLVTLVTEGDDAGKIKRFDVFLDHTPIRQKIEAVNKRSVLH